MKLYIGPDKLSDLMRDSLSTDPLTLVKGPILAEKHLIALDRRLVKILLTVKECIERLGDYKKVIKFDGR